MIAIEILREARQLIESPERWTQGALARRSDGVDCSPFVVSATCWCSIGAIEHVGAYMSKAKLDAFQALSAAVYDPDCDGDVGFWNDAHTHPEVLAAFDRAIAALESTT
jgi:hypothetical protein